MEVRNWWKLLTNLHMKKKTLRRALTRRQTDIMEAGSRIRVNCFGRIQIHISKEVDPV